MIGALISGVTGLQAFQNMLDVVGNNLSNMNTTGFKSQSAHFSDLVYQTLSQGSDVTSANLSGTDPLQVGLGVATSSISTDFSQGTLQQTGNQYDLAIQGQGYFVANNGTSDLYTRAGSFNVDQNNYLVDPATGYRVQRVGNVGEGNGVDPTFQTAGNDGIQIPTGTSIPGKATANITFQGNLSPSAAGPLAQTLTTAQAFTAGGVAAASSTALNSLDGLAHAYSPGDVIKIQGTDADGTAVSGSYTVTATSNLGNLVSAINGVFIKATASIDSSGNLDLTANKTGPGSLTMTLSDATTNKGSFPWSSHALGVTVNGSNGDTVDSSIQVYDTQGTPHTLSLVFTKQAANTWNMSASIPAGDGTMINSTVNGITFNDNGSFQQIAGGGQPSLSFQIAGMSAPQTVNLSFGTPGQFSGLTQYGGASTLAASGQDGYGAGSLTSVSVGSDGLMQGVFSNGQTLPIAQLALASFSNPGGLMRDGQNYYSLTAQSGLPVLGPAGSGGLGTIQQGTLESSNVDVALEYTNLITAQRGFQVNTRTITASDQMLQDLANIQ